MISPLIMKKEFLSAVCSFLSLAVDILQQIHNFIGIAPFIVIPGNHFEEAFFSGEIVLECSRAVIN